MPQFALPARAVRRAAAMAALAPCLLTAAPAAAATPPFAPGSVWNAPLASSAPLALSSAALVGELGRQVTQYGPWINTTAYSVPVYTVPAGQPTVPVKLDVPNYLTLQQDFSAVPLPANAVPAKGTDAHLTVYQPSTNTLWDMWKASKQADGWHFRWGGKLTGVSTSPGYWPNAMGATATSLPLLGGLIRISELQAGVIPHALALAIPQMKAKSFVWPAQRTDGTSTLANAIPAGTRFRLDPALDVEALPLKPAAKVIARAAQRYGIVVRDTAGAVTFFAEDPTRTGTNPYPALFGVQYASQLLANFPWSRLQVVAPPAG
jgi:hypothetical protein